VQKSTILNTLNELPDKFNLDEFLERLVVIEKINEGMVEAKAGKMVRLTGKGIPFPNQNRWGDFYVTYKVHVPSRVSSKAKKLLEELSTELA
jgi:DnaJ-class molecular chaperone